MIKEECAEDYTKSFSKDIPKGNYILNRDKSYCKNNYWLFTSQSSFVKSAEWLISPHISYSIYAARLYSSGFVSLYGYGSNGVNKDLFAVRQTFYLDSSVLKIVGGDKTQVNPYRIG